MAVSSLTRPRPAASARPDSAVVHIIVHLPSSPRARPGRSTLAAAVGSSTSPGRPPNRFLESVSWYLAVLPSRGSCRPRDPIGLLRTSVRISPPVRGLTAATLRVQSSWFVRPSSPASKEAGRKASRVSTHHRRVVVTLLQPFAPPIVGCEKHRMSSSQALYRRRLAAAGRRPSSSIVIIQNFQNYRWRITARASLPCTSNYCKVTNTVEGLAW